MTPDYNFKKDMYYLDLLGTLAFAITGAYKGKQAKLNIFGVILLGIVTAVGGGTFRDLIIGRTPLIYLHDPKYILVSVFAGLMIYFIPNFFKKGYAYFRFTDSIGLAAFAILGVSITYSHLFNYAIGFSTMSFLACTLLGTLTGCGGGIIRDAIMGDTPFSLKKGSNYISSAFWGSLIYYVFMFNFNAFGAICAFLVIIYLREISSEFGYYKTIYRRTKNI
jgi:uncharacterized membrane protein YeiH